MKTRKFKRGDKVICNGNSDATIIGYPYEDSNIVEVRLWSGTRLVGDVAVDEADVQKLPAKTRKQAIDALKSRGEAIEPNQETEKLIENEIKIGKQSKASEGSAAKPKVEHTPTPWIVYQENIKRPIYELHSVAFDEPVDSRNLVAVTNGRPGDAEFIVRAVNSHEALLDQRNRLIRILEALKDDIENGHYSFKGLAEMIDNALYEENKAIEQAEGGK